MYICVILICWLWTGVKFKDLHKTALVGDTSSRMCRDKPGNQAAWVPPVAGFVKTHTAAHIPYKHFWSWPPSGEWQYSGGRGSHLFTSSSPLANHWSSWGGSAQRRPAATIQPVILAWKLTLCHWGRQSCGLRMADGPQNQWSGTSVGTEVDEDKRVGSVVVCHRQSAGGPLAVHLTIHPWATQWVRVS